MREIKFRAWNGEQMDYDYRDACLWNGLLVAEGDTILMQFTGLKDRTGKDIYEGDIVDFQTFDAKGVVTYVAPRFLASGHELQGYEVEITGNVYETPELVKT